MSRLAARSAMVRDAQDAMKAARRPAQTRRRVLQEARSGRVEAAMQVERVAGQAGVAAALARLD
jgi:hypothetical protein